MTIAHRHLDLARDTSTDDLPLDAIDDMLDRGDLDDWRPLAVAVRDDPRGRLADRILRLCRSHEMYGTSRLWIEFITRLRGDTEGSAVRLAALRQRRGRTQAEVAQDLGITQSDVSKLERRDDLRLSTLRRYVSALGGELRLTATFPPTDGAAEQPATIEFANRAGNIGERRQRKSAGSAHQS